MTFEWYFVSGLIIFPAKITTVKKILFLLIFASSAVAMTARDSNPLKLYVGTFTSEGAEGVYLCSFDTVTGKLEKRQVFKGFDNPSYLQSSADGKYLYVVNRATVQVEPTGGFIVAFRINDNGSLSFLNKQPSYGADPCYVDVSTDGKFAAIANYGGGTVALYPVDENGKLLPATSVVQHRGSGPNTARQGAPHAHSIRFSPFSSQLFSADLGTDQLLIYDLSPATRQMTPAAQPFAALPPGSGPRHFDFSADGKFIYVVNELNSTVTIYENQNGRFTELQSVATVPAGTGEGNYCADIHLSADEKFLYVSNRGHNSIAVFSRHANGLLTLRTNVSTRGDWPRNFTIDPTGKFLLAANQRSGNIVVFKLENGIPVFSGNELAVPAPVCLEFLKEE